LFPEQQWIFSGSVLQFAPERFLELQGLSALALLQRLGYDGPSDPPCPTPAFRQLLDRELLLVSGEDYRGSHQFQERFVAFDSKKLPDDVYSADAIQELRDRALGALERILIRRSVGLISEALIAIQGLVADSVQKWPLEKRAPRASFWQRAGA
jgi:hypothetical protein